MYIERKVPYLYDPDSPRRYTNYWMALRDLNENIVGVMGIAVDIEEYE